MNDENPFGPGFDDPRQDTDARRPAVLDEFVTQRIVRPVKRERGTDATTHHFAMRVRVAASNEFVRYCNKHRLSYREGFDRVLEVAMPMLERET
jgi:hypothetical protein